MFFFPNKEQENYKKLQHIVFVIVYKEVILEYVCKWQKTYIE